MAEIHQCQLITIVSFLNGEFRFVLLHLHLHDVVAGAHTMAKCPFHILLQLVEQGHVATCHLTEFLGFHSKIVGFVCLHHHFRFSQTYVLLCHVDTEFRHLVGCGDFTSSIDRLHQRHAAHEDVLEFPIHRLRWEVGILVEGVTAIIVDGHIGNIFS